MTHLETQTQKKALLAARARAQVVIDVLVRNLFERTADIGFLAADATYSPLGGRNAEAESAATSLRSLQRHFAEYVAKYSVYHNVILISATGEVLAQLENGSAPAMTHDSLVANTVANERSHVESCRQSDLVPGARRALIYSQRIASERRTLGVLCLCFRLEDEWESLFAKLRSAPIGPSCRCWMSTTRCLRAATPTSCLSGARVAPGERRTGDIVRFAGREFLAVTRDAQPYQGYAGPQWRGHVMVPLERAFETDERAADLGCTSEVLTDLRASAATFSTALREIPRKADSVQRDLNRSVWNGSVRLSFADGGNGTFAKALLREISNMGRKTKEVFEHSIEELHETIVSSVLQDSQFMASLAERVAGA